MIGGRDARPTNEEGYLRNPRLPSTVYRIPSSIEVRFLFWDNWIGEEYVNFLSIPASK